MRLQPPERWRSPRSAPFWCCAARPSCTRGRFSPPRGSPAAVLPLHVQRRLSPSEAQAGKGVIQGECHVAQAVGAIWLIVHVLPVGAEARGARGVVPVQVIVQLPDDFLIHHGFEFSGKEGGPGCLLCSWDKKKQCQGVGWGREWGFGERGSASHPVWIHIPALTLSNLSVLSFPIRKVEILRSVLGLNELIFGEHLKQ